MSSKSEADKFVTSVRTAISVTPFSTAPLLPEIQIEMFYNSANVP